MYHLFDYILVPYSRICAHTVGTGWFPEFSQFIAPKVNETIPLKDHRFNRLNDCCLTALYHFDDISEFLQKFESVTNNMAILDCSFVGMGNVLKPIFCATAVLGHHIM